VWRELCRAKRGEFLMEQGGASEQNECNWQWLIFSPSSRLAGFAHSPVGIPPRGEIADTAMQLSLRGWRLSARVTPRGELRSM